MFTALGLKSSDIFYQEKVILNGSFSMTTPDIAELMMLKPELINMYMVLAMVWPSSQKQQGIDVVMEGCLHDIVRFVAGGEHLRGASW